MITKGSIRSYLHEIWYKWDKKINRQQATRLHTIGFLQLEVQLRKCLRKK